MSKLIVTFGDLPRVVKRTQGKSSCWECKRCQKKHSMRGGNTYFCDARPGVDMFTKRNFPWDNTSCGCYEEDE